jgi:hypothetical protein
MIQFKTYEQIDIVKLSFKIVKPINIKKARLSFLLLFVFFFGNSVFGQCVNQAVNGSFETPVIPAVSFRLLNESTVTGWTTSATDDLIEIWSTNFLGVPAYSGQQFAELNATQASTLTQTFSVAQSGTIKVHFAHRGRMGTDVMNVSIGPSGGTQTSLGNFTDGNTAWGVYDISYNIPAAGTYTLNFTAVSSAGGIAAGNLIDDIQFTFTEIPNLSGSNIACNNSVQSYSVSNATAFSSFNWSVTNGTIISGQGTNTVNVLWNTTGIGVVSVATTDVFTNCPATKSTNVTVTKPNAGADISGVCEGSSQNLIGSPTGGTWSTLSTNPIGASLVGNTVSFVSTGTYNFIYTQGGCTDTVAVIVTAKPNAGVDISGICAGISQVLTGSPLGGIWNALSTNPAGASLIGNTVSFATSATGTYNFIYTQGGCTDTVAINVNAKPNAGADISGVCVGSSQVLTGTPVGGIWSALSTNPAGASLVGNTVSFTTTATGTYNFIYTQGGCSDTVAINLATKPNAGSDIYVECGASSTVSLVGSPVGGVWSALTTNPSGISLAGNTVSLTSVSTGTWSFIYSVNGCTDTVNLTVGVNGNPSPSINGGTNPICKNGTVQLCPTVWGWSNFQWYKNGVAIAAPFGTSSCITLDSTGVGSYTLAASNGAGCWSALSTPIVVTYDNTCNGSVTTGGSGGVESKTLGNIIGQRLYSKAISSQPQEATSSTIVFTKSTTIVNGPNDLKLSDLVPSSLQGTSKTLISSPNDLINFTNAVEVLSVDYINNNSIKAVAFGTQTIGEVYNHTKPICDRLKGAELLEVKTINVNGYKLMAYKVRQCSGEVEYTINLNAGVKVGRNSISVQSNWFTDSYTTEDKMFNFQLWAVSYEMASNLAKDILTKLQQHGTIQTITSTDLPQAYVTKGKRVNSKVILELINNTTTTNAVVELRERLTETSVEVTRQIPVALISKGQSTIVLDVKDNYEATIALLVNGSKADMLYLNDGTWALDYNRANTSIQEFFVSNDVAQLANTNDYNLLRSISFKATSKDYVTAYKTIGTKCQALSISDYNSLKFTANAVGASSVKVTLISNEITNWNEQYTATVTLDGNKEYGIALNDFVSSKYGKNAKANQITGISFAFNNSRGSNTSMNASLSKARLTKDMVANTGTPLMVKVYPNPVQNGFFTTSFNSEVEQSIVIRVVEVATGKVVKTQFVQAKKGSNQVNIQLLLPAISMGNYAVELIADNGKYQTQKLLMNK